MLLEEGFRDVFCIPFVSAKVVLKHKNLDLPEVVTEKLRKEVAFPKMVGQLH